MLTIIFFICIIICLKDRNFIVPIAFIAALLFPIHARVLGLAFNNAITFSLFGIWFYYRKRYKNTSDDDKYISYFLIYYFLIRIIFIFLAADIPINVQLQANKDILVVLFIYAEWKLLNSRSINNIYQYVPILLLLVSVYGIYTYFTQSNPYIDWLSDSFTASFFDLSAAQAQYAQETRGGLISRATGISFSPLEYAILLGIFFYICMYLYNVQKKRVIILLSMLFAFVAMFLTGSRGPLLAFVLPLAILLFMQQKGIRKVYYALAVFAILFIISNIDFLAKYVTFAKSFVFIFDETRSDALGIQGSSVSGRFTQLQACFNLLKDDRALWFGNGFGYTQQYLNNYGFGTEALGFESVVFGTMVNNGILGLISIFIFKYIFLYYIVWHFFSKQKISKYSFLLILNFLFMNFLANLFLGSTYEYVYLFVYFFLLKAAIIKNEYKKL